MPLYSVYGARLDSSIEFPELPIATRGPARWRFRVDPELPEMQAPVERGAERIYGDVHARLFAHRRGLRVCIDDTGDFDIAPNGSVVAAIRDGAFDDFVRNHLLGRVLAVALFEAGFLPMHASAVRTDDGVVAFLGPNGTGKSALATALARVGAEVTADDTLPLEASEPPRAWPGLPAVRLRDDVRHALHLDNEPGLPTHEGKTVRAPEKAAVAPAAPLPLAGLYLLAPSYERDSGAPVLRTPFSPALAAPALIAHIRAGALLGSPAVSEIFARISPIVRYVPVHQLSITRDLSRLEDAAREVLGWYA